MQPKEMDGYIQYLSGVLRIGEKCKKYGDPYEWSCALNLFTPKRVEILGVDKEVLPSIRRTIRSVLERDGFDEGFYQRINEDGTTKLITLTKRDNARAT